MLKHVLARLLRFATVLLALQGGLAFAQAAAGASGDAASDWVRRQAVVMQAPRPSLLSDAQLHAFGEAVGEARVVALAEQTHGGREEFELRLRLLRYLHERKGFDLLLLESGVFDIAQLTQAMRQGSKLDELAPGNVFYMYANSDAGRELLRYVDERQTADRPLHLAGFDSQLSGERSQRELLPRLRPWADKAKLSDDWPLFERLTAQLFSLNRRAPPTDQQQRFDALAAALQQWLCAAEGDGLLCRSVASLQAQAATLWRGDYQRDHAMADNLLWQLQNQHPGRKAVVWGHIIHLARGVRLDETQRFAGDLLGAALGRDYYVLNTTALQGSFLEFASGQVHPIAPAYPRSLEAVLGELPADLAFLHAPQPLPPGVAGLQARAMEFGYGLPVGAASGLGRHWDGVFFIREMRPVTMER